MPASFPFLPRRPITGRTAIWAFLLAVGLVCPLTLFIFSLPLPSLAGEVAARQARFFDYVLHPFSLFFKAVIIVPILEEVCYRGSVLQLLRRYTSTATAVFISTAFFAITHLGQGWGAMVNAFLMGLVLAALAVRTGSLLTAIICHAAFNFSWLFLIGPAFGITAMAVESAPASLTAAQPYPLWWIGISMGLVLAAGVMLIKFSAKPISRG